MKSIKKFAAQFYKAGRLLRWTVLIFPVAIVVGLLVAFFLWLLDIATVTRWQHPWLLFLLPLAGVVIAWLYGYFGKNAEAGNNLNVYERKENNFS